MKTNLSKEEVRTAEGASTKSNYFLRLEQLEYPHREICGLCHRAVAVGFWVPDKIWSAVVHHRYATAIHCLNCFIERADEKLIDWSKEIKFYAVSLRSHLDDIHSGNDEMTKFHTPPASQFKSQSEAVGWISVKDRLPEDQQSVLCYNGFNAVMAKYRKVTNEASPRFGDVGDFEVEKYPDKYDRVSSSYWSNITHWQPLPSPPEVSVGEEKKD